MNPKPNKKSILFLLFFFSVLYFLPIIKLQANPLDEGVILTGAERVLKGQFPYRDFFSLYAPGQFYVLSAIFKIFGISIDVARIYDIIVRALICVVIFSILRRIASTKAAYLGWAMAVIWIGSNGFSNIPTYPSLLYVYIGIYCFIRYCEMKHLNWIICCAMFSLLAFLFRQDFGVMFAIVVVSVLLIESYASSKLLWRPLTCYVLTGITALIPVSIYFLMNMDVKYIIEDLIVFPLTVYPKYRWIPFPRLSLSNISFYVSPIIPIIGVITSLVIIKRERVEDKVSTSGYAALLISLLGFFFLNQIRTRSDMTHLIPVAMTGILLSPIVLHIWLREGIFKIGRINKVAAGVFIIFISLILILPVGKKVRLFFYEYSISAGNQVIKRAGHSYTPKELSDTVEYIMSITSKDDFIYVGVKNHDQFVLNDAIIYFLAGRNIATRSHELHPGLSNTLEMQKEIVDELKRTSTKVIALAPRSWKEKNLSSVDMGFNIIDDYIASEFKLSRQYGQYEVWVKKVLGLDG